MLTDHEQQMSVFHKALLTLLADTRAYQQFSRSPTVFARSFGGLSPELVTTIAGIDPQGLQTFRQIVRGTREERLIQVFPGLVEKYANREVWNAMIARFLDDVVIRNGRTDEDLQQFVEWLEENEPNSAFDYASLELAIYTVSNQPPMKIAERSLRGSNLRLKIRAGCKMLRVRWSVEDLFSLTLDDLEATEQSISSLAIYLPDGADDLKLIELPESIALNIDKESSVDPSLISVGHIEALKGVGAKLEDFLEEFEAV